MGIRLDWEIQAEQAQVQNGGEDPNTARARRRARLRFMLVVMTLLVIAAAIMAGVVLRLREVDKQIEQSLRDTVEAEVAALRLGNREAFIDLQRSASAAWLQHQQLVFEQYQRLKVEQDVQLTGQVLDAAVSGMRGRVKIEEIIDGIPYAHLWFYWRYEDGWYHVPPDYTFWGELRTYVGENVTIRYRAVDDALAADMGFRLEKWLKTGCEILSCAQLPKIGIEIVPDEGLQMGWSAGDPWLLQLPSPYIETTRSDVPFDSELQIEAAGLLAERLVAYVSSSMQPVYPADAYFLRSAVVSWLVGRFAEVDTQSYLITSLARVYGDALVGRLVQWMQPDSNVGVLSLVTGIASLDQTQLDWRDFLSWRLTVEDELIARGDELNFVTLYDTRDEQLRSAAYFRYDRYDPNIHPEPKAVILAMPETGIDGSPQLRATVQIGEEGMYRQEQVLFRLVNNVWRRAS